ncbi:hypothetical protein [Herbaspirillum rubrisubalbicans]|uniref:hypothetical protein n=1 Tax=Herbaspirillum rubrisubalbicans TaxID=80842 RepID=UPI0020A6244E|nr:hypothetical protein [Herbaspirillum rubrisubalbicans]
MASLPCLMAEEIFSGRSISTGLQGETMKVASYQPFQSSSQRIEQGYQGDAAKAFSAVLAQTSKQANDASPSAASGTTSANRNISSMTPAEMRSFAKELYNAGKIDLEAMISLTLVGPIGKAGPHGEFIPFSESERQAIDNTPVNYHQIAATYIARIESDGRQLDPTSGYQKWRAIQTALKNYPS